MYEFKVVHQPFCKCFVFDRLKSDLTRLIGRKQHLDFGEIRHLPRSGWLGSTVFSNLLLSLCTHCAVS